MNKPKIRRDLIARSGGAFCQGCDHDFNFDPRNLVIDHIRPKSDGGTDDLDNLALLCNPCNQVKSNKLTLSGLRTVNRKAGRMNDLRGAVVEVSRGIRLKKLADEWMDGFAWRFPGAPRDILLKLADEWADEWVDKGGWEGVAAEKDRHAKERDAAWNHVYQSGKAAAMAARERIFDGRDRISHDDLVGFIRDEYNPQGGFFEESAYFMACREIMEIGCDGDWFYREDAHQPE